MLLSLPLEIIDYLIAGFVTKTNIRTLLLVNKQLRQITQQAIIKIKSPIPIHYLSQLQQFSRLTLLYITMNESQLFLLDSTKLNIKTYRLFIHITDLNASKFSLIVDILDKILSRSTKVSKILVELIHSHQMVASFFIIPNKLSIFIFKRFKGFIITTKLIPIIDTFRNYYLLHFLDLSIIGLKNIDHQTHSYIDDIKELKRFRFNSKIFDGVI